MIFQDPSGALNPRHSIYESVAEGLRIHKVKGGEAALVADALAEAGLRPPDRFVRRFPHEVSGGQRQRVLIAGAMALRPRLLLADEPVASLDASIRGEILALMRSYVDRDGVSIIAVTHDLGLAWNIADRVAVMYLGRIVEIGPAEEVLRSPQHPYTRALLSVVPEIEGMEQQILTGETPDPSRVPAGCRFHPRCPLVASGDAERMGILDKCRGVDLELEPEQADHRVACHAVHVSPRT
jgi:peptide/nickel transport system ATP-binding protein